MPQHHTHPYLRISCALLTVLVSVIYSHTLFAQVPTSTYHTGSSAIVESAFPTASKVVKVMAPESAIPFGVQKGSRNVAFLEMKGNDQEYTRKFTFKNTSSASYTVSAIDFEKKDHRFDFMSIESGESLPMEVPPGHSFTIRIAFHATELNFLCSDKLNFRTEESEEPISYSIHGKQESWQTMPWNNATASVQTN